MAKLIVERWPRARLNELLPESLVRAHPELRMPAARVRGLRATAEGSDLLRLR